MFGHIVGVHSPISSVVIAGIIIHIIVGISIGILSGVFLYKTNILNISKPSNRLRYGLFVGILVYLIFAIPVQHFVLNPEIRHVLEGSNNNNDSNHDGSLHKSNGSIINSDLNMNANNNKEKVAQRPSNNDNNNVTFSNFQLSSILYSILINLLFGITLGLFSSFLSIKFGARYRCPSCDISFSRIDILQNHLALVHSSDNDKHQQTTNRKRIVILGGGFVGVAGMIETRHIVTPIREFCKRS